MSTRARFMFDADFGDKRATEAPKITEAALKAAVADAEARGYQNGMNAAEAKARTEAERRTAAALDNIAKAVARIAQSLHAVEGRLDVEAVEIATTIATKLAPALIAREPVGEIAQLASSCFAELRHAPHVAVRVHAQDHALAQDTLTRIAAAQGFEGRLIVMGDDTVARGDCRLEWADGGIVRDTGAVSALIEEAVNNYVAGHRSGDGKGNSEE